MTITPPARALLAALLVIPGGANTLMAQTRTTHVLTLEAARKAATAAEAEARRQGWEMSIAIVDPSGSLLHFIRMDGAPASSLDLSLEPVGDDLGPLVVRPPALDQSRLEVHDPVFRHPRALIAAALELAVETGGGRREDLDDQQELGNLAPLAQLAAGGGSIYEHVGLEDFILAEVDIGRRTENVGGARCTQVLVEQDTEPKDCDLMHAPGCRSHDQLAFDQLVTLSVVGESPHPLRGPGSGSLRHAHNARLGAREMQ
jgi:hypothetical protein